MSIPAKHFYMIRHGETEANAAKTMAGSLDSPLTNKGRAQAKKVQPVLKALEIKPVAIIHSHLSRARDTAAILNEVLELPMSEDPDLAEMHAGDWEGVPYMQCQAMHHGWANPPGGETYTEFFARVKRAKIKALNSTEGPVLIVCHGGVFRAFSKFFEIDSYGVRNCHLYEFTPAPQNKEFPWETRHYEHYDSENETLLCDCTLENRAPMTRPSTMSAPPIGKSTQVTATIRRSPCDLFHANNVSSSEEEESDEIAS